MQEIRLSREDIHRGSLILVNSLHAYKEQESLQLSSPFAERKEILMEETAARPLCRLLTDINGWREIVPVSGWRSCAEQEEIWDDSLAQNGLEFTRTYVAAPGHSEHQTGLAIDLGKRQETIDFICPDFPYEGVCQAFREKAAEYGFIERYLPDKETVTGIGHEPWHFRYVGAPHAQIMEREGLALEEYIAFLKDYSPDRPYRFPAKGKRASVAYIAAEENTTVIGTVHLSDKRTCMVSGNNVDGFIVTLWERG